MKMNGADDEMECFAKQGLAFSMCQAFDAITEYILRTSSNLTQCPLHQTCFEQTSQCFVADTRWIVYDFFAQ